jgi:hypothetical protein
MRPVDAVAQIDDARRARLAHRRDEAVEQGGRPAARQNVPIRATVDVGDDADADPVSRGVTEPGGADGATPGR